MEGNALQELIKRHVAEQVLPFARRIADLERQVQQLQAELHHKSRKKTSVGGHDTDSSTTLGIASSSSATPGATPSPRAAQASHFFVALSDEALSLILSYLPLRSPFLLHQCSRLQRGDFCTRSHLIWTSISEFVSVQALRSNAACSAARSLYQWASKAASATCACDDDLALLSDEGDQAKQVTYEVCLEGSMALSISRSYLATVYSKDSTSPVSSEKNCAALREASQTAVNIVREVLQGADCRLCRRTGTGFRSEEGESGGHTNRYEAEFVIPASSDGSCDQLRLGINVCKCFTEGACGWDEGLDVNCFVDGREMFNLHRDGSDSEYDSQSVNRGLLHQLAAQMLVPASESMVVLTMLWQILCAPLLACSRWDEEAPRLGLGLPHRKDNPFVFRTLGTMFTNLASSVAGDSVGPAVSIPEPREDAAICRFLSFVLDK